MIWIEKNLTHHLIQKEKIMEHVEKLWNDLLSALRDSRELITLRDITNYHAMAIELGDAPGSAKLEGIERFLIEGDVRQGRERIQAVIEELIVELLPIVERVET